MTNVNLGVVFCVVFLCFVFCLEYCCAWLSVPFHQHFDKENFPTQILTETIYTTLMRDHNGLGFSIAGGRGAAQYKDGSDVSMKFLYMYMLGTSKTLHITEYLSVSGWLVELCYLTCLFLICFRIVQVLTFVETLLTEYRESWRRRLFIRHEKQFWDMIFEWLKILR